MNESCPMIGENRNRAKRFIQTSLCRRSLFRFSSDSEVNNAALCVAAESGRIFDYDCVRQALSLVWVRKALSKNFLSSRTICVIGDGYGYFGSLIKRIYPNTTLLSVNLGRSLIFDVHYSGMTAPNCKMHLLTADRKDLLVGAFNFLEAEQFSLLEGQSIDLFVNIASMQEIDPPVTARYFELMRLGSSQEAYFYCCNREKKILPDGTVTEFAKYPWKNSRIIFDEICAWCDSFPASYPPFWRPYDGPSRHRLVQIKP